MGGGGMTEAAVVTHGRRWDDIGRDGKTWEAVG